ncbi:MAG: heavy-metal-associated domain-containing protein [Lachnospiraceae bacterium]|nr:heavy-metal-associated domain-containing protein [Lachnospiraceae bacterium]
MTKTYILEDLDCANCLAKIEKEVSKVDGIRECRITLLTQKMFIEAEESADINKITDAIKKIVKKFEPNVTIR